MKRAGRTTIFEIGDMIGQSSCSTTGTVYTQGRVSARYTSCRCVPSPFYDGLIARVRAAWEVFRGNAYPVAWPKPGDLESAINQ